MVTIPLAPIPTQRLRIVLDNQDCEMELLTRGDHMFFNLTSNGTVIQNGAIVEDAVSIIQNPNDVFTGTLAMVDTRGNSAPWYDGLNERWFLCYWSEGEAGAPAIKSPSMMD